MLFKHYYLGILFSNKLLVKSNIEKIISTLLIHILYGLWGSNIIFNPCARNITHKAKDVSIWLKKVCCFSQAG